MKHFESCFLTKIGVCSRKNEIRANIILAGDPKQLDAVCKSTVTVKLGFNISFMERLYMLPLYSKNTKTGKYNSKYITQLVKNYRSHKTILHVANALFYDGALIPKASRGNRQRNEGKIMKSYILFANFTL